MQVDGLDQGDLCMLSGRVLLFLIGVVKVYLLVSESQTRLLTDYHYCNREECERFETLFRSGPSPMMREHTRL